MSEWSTGEQTNQWMPPQQHTDWNNNPQQQQQGWNSQGFPQQGTNWGATPATTTAQTTFAPPAQGYAPQQQQQATRGSQGGQQQWGTNNNWEQEAYNAMQHTITSNPIVASGVAFGTGVFNQQIDDITKTVIPSTWKTLKTYFLVNNSFVLKKVSTLLFPFAKKVWTRSTGLESLPSKDVNAPDLYIPLMALTSYVLTVGLAKGTSSMAFDPEVIVDSFGSSITVQLLQVGIMRAALWGVGTWVPAIPWLDLIAFSGYQYVGVALNMLIGLLFGSFFYNLSLIWTASCAAFVMFRTMQEQIPPPPPDVRGRRRRLYFLATCAFLQIFFMWFLGYTRELRASGALTFGGSSSSFTPPITGTQTAGQTIPKETVKLPKPQQTLKQVDEDDIYQETEPDEKPVSKKRGKVIQNVDVDEGKAATDIGNRGSGGYGKGGQGKKKKKIDNNAADV